MNVKNRQNYRSFYPTDVFVASSSVWPARQIRRTAFELDVLDQFMRLGLLDIEIDNMYLSGWDVEATYIGIATEVFFNFFDQNRVTSLLTF